MAPSARSSSCPKPSWRIVPSRPMTMAAGVPRILNRRMVVLLSGALDSILLKGDMQQVAWLVGHELAHHRAGHLDFVRKLADVGDWCVWLKLWYSRRAELTCDRMGLYCAGSLRASQLALVNATVGAQLAAKVNTEEAIRQWQAHRREFFVQYRTLYSTHPQHLARLENLSQAAAELGQVRAELALLAVGAERDRVYAEVRYDF